MNSKCEICEENGANRSFNLTASLGNAKMDLDCEVCEECLDYLFLAGVKPT